MATFYCTPCGQSGRPVPATVEVDGVRMCAGCASLEPSSCRRLPIGDVAHVRSAVLSGPVYLQPAVVRRASDPRRDGYRITDAVRKLISSEPAETTGVELAAKYGCSSATILNIRRAAGIRLPERRSGPVSKAMVEAAIVRADENAEFSSEVTRAIDGETWKREIPIERDAAAADSAFHGKVGRNLVTELVSKTVAIEELPESLRLERSAKGRLAHLWVKLKSLAPGEAEEIQNRDRRHATATLCHIRSRAKKEKFVVHDRRVGNVLYLWLVPVKNETQS